MVEVSQSSGQLTDHRLLDLVCELDVGFDVEELVETSVWHEFHHHGQVGSLEARAEVPKVTRQKTIDWKFVQQ